jgi:hypothetical protein
MNARHWFIPASSFQLGSVGSFRYAALIIPVAFSGPAGVMTDPTDIETFVMQCSGFQPRSAIFRIV